MIKPQATHLILCGHEQTRAHGGWAHRDVRISVWAYRSASSVDRSLDNIYFKSCDLAGDLADQGEELRRLHRRYRPCYRSPVVMYRAGSLRLALRAGLKLSKEDVCALETLPSFSLSSF